MSRLATLLKQARSAGSRAQLEAEVKARAREEMAEGLLPVSDDMGYITPEPGVAGPLDPDGLRVSTRKPTSPKTRGTELENELIVGVESLMMTPAQMDKVAAELAGQLGIGPVRGRKADSRLVEVLNQQVENLLWLFDQVPPEIRQRSQQWYDGANKFVHEWADQSKQFSSRGVAGAVAALSPQRDWYQNASLAARVMDVMENHGDDVFDEEMLRAFTTAVETGKDGKGRPLTRIAGFTPEEASQQLLGRTFNELEGNAQAAFIRAYDKAYNSPMYEVVTPEGDFIGVASRPAKPKEMREGGPLLLNDGTYAQSITWGGSDSIVKAISMLRDDSIENISEQLGSAHKIRNFYNNIIDPDDPNAVTIDTHAVAAALLRPLSGNSPEVAYNFGGAGSAITGTQGSYGATAEAYRIAAQARGILPRQMQSITWEAVRGLYTAGYKQGLSRQRTPLRKGGRPRLDEIDQVAQEFKRGRITVDEFRSRILDIAAPDGIRDPTWLRSIIGPAAFTALVSGMTPQEAEAAPFGTLRKVAGEALDMSDAARMERAREMGFDTERVWYHGTQSPEDFASLIPGRGERGMSRLQKSRNIHTDGIFVANNPERAAEFAGVGDVTDAIVPGSRVLPVHLRVNNPRRLSAEDLQYETAEELLAQGYDGVELMETNELIALRPEDVRSTFAAFDPAKSDSSNLLAGVGGAAVGAGLLAPQEAEAGRLNWARGAGQTPRQAAMLETGDYEVVELPIAPLIDAGPSNMDVRNPQNRIGTRLEDTRARLEQGLPMDMAVAGASPDGSAAFIEDGRHRLAAALELGAETAPVVVPRGQGEALRRIASGVAAATATMAGPTLASAQEIERQIEGLKPSQAELVVLEGLRDETRALLDRRAEIEGLDPAARDQEELDGIEARLEELRDTPMIQMLRDRQQSAGELRQKYREVTGANYGEATPPEQRIQNIATDTADRFAALRMSPRANAIENYAELIRRQPSSPWGAWEAGLTMASGIASEIFGGLTMLGAAPFEGLDEARRRGEAVQEAATYQPRTDAGRETLEGIGEVMAFGIDEAMDTEIGRFLAPVGDYWRDEVVPSLQDELGTEAGSAAAALGVGVLNTL